MQKIRVPVGISDFREIRKKKLYLVDKTNVTIQSSQQNSPEREQAKRKKQFDLIL